MPVAIGTVKIKNLPEATCFKTFEEFLLALQTYLVIEIPDTITNVVVGSSEPSSSQRDSIWYRFNSTGDFLGIYLFSGGSWNLQIPAGLVPTGPNQILYSNASQELAWTIIGPNSTFVSDSVAMPFWLPTGASGSIYFSAGGVPTWLAPGTADQVLKIVGGVPVWSDPSINAWLVSYSYFAVSASTVNVRRSPDTNTGTTQFPFFWFPPVAGFLTHVSISGADQVLTGQVDFEIFKNGISLGIMVSVVNPNTAIRIPLAAPIPFTAADFFNFTTSGVFTSTNATAATQYNYTMDLWGNTTS